MSGGDLPTCVSQACSEATLDYLKTRVGLMLTRGKRRGGRKGDVFRILSVQPDASACGFEGELGIALSTMVPKLGLDFALDLVGEATVMTRLMEAFGSSGVLDRFSHLGSFSEFLASAESGDGAAEDTKYDLIILPLWRLSHEHQLDPQVLGRLVKACYARLRPDFFSTLLVLEPETAQGIYAARGVLCEHLSTEGLFKLGAAPPQSSSSDSKKKDSGGGSGSGGACCFSTKHGFNPVLDVRSLHKCLAVPAADGSKDGKDEGDTDEEDEVIDVYCEPLDAAADLTAAVKTYKMAEAEIRNKSSGKAGGQVSAATSLLSAQGSSAAAACAMLSEVFGCDAARLLTSHPEVAMDATDEMIALSLFNVRMVRSSDPDFPGFEAIKRGLGPFPSVIGHVPLRAFHVVKGPRSLLLAATAADREEQERTRAGKAKEDQEEEDLLSSPAHKRQKTSGEANGAAGRTSSSASSSSAASTTSASSAGGGGLFSSLSTVAFSALEVVSSVTGLGSSSLSSSSSSISMESAKVTAVASNSAAGAGGEAGAGAPRKKWWLTDLADGLGGAASKYGHGPPAETADYSHFWDRMPGGQDSREKRYFASRNFQRFPLAIPPLPLLYCVPGHLDYASDGTHRLLPTQTSRLLLGSASMPDEHTKRGKNSSGGSGSGSVFKIEVEEMEVTTTMTRTTTTAMVDDGEGTATGSSHSSSTGKTKTKAVTTTTSTTVSASMTGAGKWKELDDEPPALVAASAGAAAAVGPEVRFDPCFPHGEGRGFVNVGVARWNAQRAKWQSRPPGYRHPPYPSPDIIDEVEDMLFDLTDTSVREMDLPGPVRLPDMLDLLVDSWSPVSEDSDTDEDW